MSELLWFQYLLIAVLFVWSGFVRSGLGFGGAVLSLPFLLLIRNDPLVFLPLISVHLLFFSALTVIQNNTGNKRTAASQAGFASSIDWGYLKKVLGIMIIPKLVGVFGLVTLPATILSSIIFIIVAVYSTSYILNKPFRSQNRWVDTLFLILGGYISGTSLIGAPLVIAVMANHIDKRQLRDTLFVLWFILVTIKMAAFIYVGVDLQLIHHLWLLPCAAVGHIIGLHFHEKILHAETPIFFRVVGSVLLITSLFGLSQALFSP